jgi:tight adherence protein C
MAPLILIVLLVAVSAYLVIEQLSAGRKLVALNLRRAKRYGGYAVRDVELSKGAGDRLLAPVAGRLADIAIRVTPKGNIDDVRRKLLAAGMNRITPQTFLAAKCCASGLVAGLATLMVATGAQPAGKGLFIGAAGAAAFFLLPDTYLGMKQRSRQDEIVAALPDVLDLMTVSVEAGLGFDAAVAKVCERMHGPLVDEFRSVLHEMRIGESRVKALKNMAERVDAPECSTFVRSIVQADQLGMSLGRILRVQAQDMRHKRQMAAEERAMKAPIKMLFPTAVFIFPAMFIVALGPAMISLLELFS